MQKRVRTYWRYAFLVLLVVVVLPLWSVWIIIHPDRMRHGSATPEDIGASYEEVTIPADGVTLSAWYIPALTGTDKVVILVHGYTYDKATMLSVAKALHPSVNLLLVDLRHHGASSGVYSTFGIRESTDLSYAVTFLAERGMNRIGMLGYSLGAATALMTAGSDSRIDAVVAYAPFASVMRLADDAYAWMGVARGPFVSMMDVWTRIFFGADPNAANPVTLARNIRVPVLHVHSQSDDLIPFENATLIRSALSNAPSVEVWYPPRGSHIEIPFTFNERVLEFFLRVL